MTDSNVLTDRHSFLELIDKNRKKLPVTFEIECELNGQPISILRFSSEKAAGHYQYSQKSKFFRARFGNKKFSRSVSALLEEFDEIFLSSIVIKNLSRQEDYQKAREFLNFSSKKLSTNAYDAFSSIAKFVPGTIHSALCSITQSGIMSTAHIDNDSMPHEIREEFARICRRASISDVSKHRAILHRREVNHYYFFPIDLSPFAFNEVDHPQVLVLVRRDRLSQDSLTELSALVNLAQQELTQSRLALVQKYSDFDFRDKNGDDLNRLVLDQIATLLRGARDCTLADSVTFRQYNPVSACLEVVAKVEGAAGYSAVGSVGKISALRPEVSLNAFVFAQAKNVKNGVNIPNVLAPQSKIFQDANVHNGHWAVRNGFSQVAVSRALTRSEYSLPVFFKNLPIGTLNFESRLIGAFNVSDCSFLISVRNFLERIIRSSHESEDQKWMATQSFTTMNIHEIQQLRDSRKMNFTTEQIGELNRFIDAPTAVMTEKFDVESIIPRLCEYLLNEYTEVHFLESAEANDMVDRTVRDLGVGTSEENCLGFNQDELVLLDYILRNLAQNKARVPRKYNEQITVAVRTHLDGSKYLEIRNYIVNFESVDVNLFGLRPIPRNALSDARSHRLGLYFVGLASRRLGGSVSVFEAEGRMSNKFGATVVYSVRIPIEGVGNAKSH
jgi:hypothetical protein